MPIMLQRGFELLAGKLLLLALGYIPIIWGHIRVVYIPKPGKPLSQVNTMKPICRMSFILKTIEKLHDRHIKDGLLVERSDHQNQVACRAGMSTETVITLSTQ